MGPTTGSSLRRATTELAAIRAAGWARTDRAAALLVCLPVQQRLLRCDRLLAAWQEVRRSPRAEFLGTVIRDVCDGAQALGELDLTRLCRRVGLPAPDRQVVRRHDGGRVYLDAVWEDVGLVLEVDGDHHALALNPVDDALRQNEVTIGERPAERALERAPGMPAWGASLLVVVSG
ncbi:hypothetical protein [uncultured Phycicoccus sp.]|uniref:hypothetical protein n=1 Tax=uncultured Phycicoccus sp. TaxID=661422 RepID=UPI0026164D68|nr:hypothetical protein [uncultured Phycicoccus sp.]